MTPLMRMGLLEIQRRREAMRLARSKIRFDFSGSSPDAFTQVVIQRLGGKEGFVESKNSSHWGCSGCSFPRAGGH